MLQKVKTSRMVASPLEPRKAAGMCQREFWKPFGVMQSAGSRYENQRSLPVYLGILMVFVEFGYLTREQLIQLFKIKESAWISDLTQVRTSQNEAQKKFWGRYGVTQSAGSRYEGGMPLPRPLVLLLLLHEKRLITEDQIDAAREIVKNTLKSRLD